MVRRPLTSRRWVGSEGLGISSPRLGCWCALLVVAALFVDGSGTCWAVFAGGCSTRSVFPSVVARPWMLHIMGGMDPKDLLRAHRRFRHGMYKVGVAGFTPRAVFFFLAVRPGCSAGMDSNAACLRPRSLPTSAAACAWLVFLVTIFYAVFSSVVDMLKILGILVGMDQKDSTSLVVFFGNGMCRAGLLVTLHPAVCSFDCRPRRQRWQYAAGFTGDEAFRAVFSSFSSGP